MLNHNLGWIALIGFLLAITLFVTGFQTLHKASHQKSVVNELRSETGMIFGRNESTSRLASWTARFVGESEDFFSPVTSAYYNPRTHRMSRLTDEHMVTLSHLKELREIFIFDAPVSNDAFRHLSTLRNLEILELHNTDATQDTVSRLVNAKSLLVVDGKHAKTGSGSSN